MKHPFVGHLDAWCEESSYRAEIICFGLVILVGLLRDFSEARWFAILFCFALVFIAELLNTAIENLQRAWHPEGGNDNVRKALDQASAAVSVANFFTTAVVTYALWRPY
jgi:diacylglycerol kinase